VVDRIARWPMPVWRREGESLTQTLAAARSDVGAMMGKGSGRVLQIGSERLIMPVCAQISPPFCVWAGQGVVGVFSEKRMTPRSSTGSWIRRPIRKATHNWLICARTGPILHPGSQRIFDLCALAPTDGTHAHHA
jgi:hypothetical protein